MHQIALIPKTLQPHLGGHGARACFLALFLIALFRVTTVMPQLVARFIGTAIPTGIPRFSDGLLHIHQIIHNEYHDC